MKNKIIKRREIAQVEVSRLYRKFLISRAGFLILNITLILMSAFMGILSAYAIAKNQHLPSVAIFVAIAFITAVIAFLNAINATFTLSNRFNVSKTRIVELENELAKLRKNEIKDFPTFLETAASADIID